MAVGRTGTGACNWLSVGRAGTARRQRAPWLLRARATMLACAAMLLVCGSMEARSNDLTSALTQAYESSPVLDGERARLRATDEAVARAQSGWRPRVRGQASYGRSHRTVDPESQVNGMSTPLNYGVTLTQPIFDGFQTTSAVRGAEARVRAGQQQLRQTEARVLLGAVTAYMDLVRDRQLVAFSRENAKALGEEVRAARARRAVREVTLTDVAQAEARQADAQARLDQAIADLRASEAEYERVIGAPPGQLTPPPMQLRLLPRSRETALQIALRESPAIAVARFQVEAARYDVDREFGAMLPDVRLEASISQDHNPGRTTDKDRTASIFGRVTVPLYSGGETRARVRAAKHQRIGRLQDLEDARRAVRSRVTAAWSRVKAGEARVRSGRTRVRAAQTALKGVRAEQTVGQRTLLDLLNAQQELLDARAGLVRAERDTIVAQYTLLSEIGSLDAAILRLPAPIYDPRAHAAQAKWSWLTIAVDDDLAPEAETPDPQTLQVEHAERKSAARVAEREQRPDRHAVPAMRLGLRGTAPVAGTPSLQAGPILRLRRVFPGDSLRH
jgi:outer membrane protein